LTIIQVENKSDFNLLISNERVDRIIEQANFYGSDNGITRGLIFCSRKNEAVEFLLFNSKGFKTVAFTGDNSEEERAKAIEKLESDNLSEKLDYILRSIFSMKGLIFQKLIR
jgi:superfamily II DNA/RNA helicase